MTTVQATPDLTDATYQTDPRNTDDPTPEDIKEYHDWEDGLDECYGCGALAPCLMVDVYLRDGDMDTMLLCENCRSRV